ncbi:MAG: lipoate protein ligase C-terminal domain-containing protein, partial [Candidatus Altiarchaeota archaeon]
LFGGINVNLGSGYESVDANQELLAFLKAPVEAYRELGINAVHRPVNDIQVDNKKIGGTGAARIGDCVVVVGSLILDFDYMTMVRVLKVPDEKFRDKVYKTMEEYLTTVRRELGKVPPREEVKNILVKNLEKTLDIKLSMGNLSPEEHALVRVFDEKFKSEEWLNRVSYEGDKTRRVKISEGVNVIESSHKVKGGLIRTTTTVDENLVRDVLISGDFFIYPDVLTEIQEEMIGSSMNADDLLGRVESVYARKNVQSPGITPEDIVDAVMKRP